MSKIFSKKPTKISLIVILFIGFVIGGYFLYINFFAKKKINKELLISIPIFPSDTAETIINYGEKVQLKIPIGQIKKIDTLNIYKVTNIDPPDFTNKLIRTYDFSFKQVNKFNKDIEIKISFKDDVKNERFEINKEINLLHYNEEKEIWESVDSEIDKENFTIYFSINHFSCFGYCEGGPFDKPHPMMQLYSRKSLELINSKPDITKSTKILESQTDFSNNTLAEALGTEMFEEAFNITANITTFSQDIVGLPFFKSFNQLAGKFGLLFSLKQFTSEMYEGKEETAKLNLAKNLILYSLGKLGSQALKTANIGIFFIDYALTKFGTKGMEIREKKYQQMYDDSQKWNQKDKAYWTKFIVDAVSTSNDLKTLLDEEMNNYLYFPFSHPTGSTIPENLHETLVSKEREKLLIILHEALKDASKEIEEKQKKDIMKNVADMKELLNRRAQVRVSVTVSNHEDESLRKETIGLPVKIIVNKNQEFWQGKTNEAGQWWFNCTWLGYLYYGKPTVAELEYKGQKLKQNIEFDNWGVAKVEFILPEDTKIEATEFNISGTYKGEYTSNLNAEECMIKGKIEIQIDALGNASLTASGTGGCNYPTWSSKITQTWKLNGKNPHYDKKNDRYHISLYGNETQQVTYINEYETTTKTHSWDDRNHGIVIYRDGTIKQHGEKVTYLKFQIRK